MRLGVCLGEQLSAGEAELHLASMSVGHLASEASAQPGQGPADAAARRAGRVAHVQARRGPEGANEYPILCRPAAVDSVVLNACEFT
jgi:hypothetical protein